MTLYELFHPLVTYMVASRYEAASGKGPEMDVLLGHIMRELSAIRKAGAVSDDLSEGMEDACRYTAFYIDYMVHEGKFSYAREWRDLGRSLYNELAGDEKFFDYMRQWLAEDTPLALDHVRLMHAMIASGFSGALERRSVQLEELLRSAAEKINLPGEEQAKHSLFEPSGRKSLIELKPCRPVLVAGLVTCACAVILVASVFFYIHTYRGATLALWQVLDKTGEYIRMEAVLHAQNSDSMVVKGVSLDRKPAEPADVASEKETEPSPPPVEHADHADISTEETSAAPEPGDALEHTLTPEEEPRALPELPQEYMEKSEQFEEEGKE